MNVEFLKRHKPGKLHITAHTPIVSIGSCFARELKVWLKLHKYTFIETAQGPCAGAGSARYDRVYNTFTLRQEFERAFGTFEPKETYWEFEEDGETRLLDPYRKNIAWEDKDDLISELAEHRETVRQAFIQAEVLVITVGQAEIWYNKTDGSVFPLVPPSQIFDPEIHGFRLSTYEENLLNLERLFELFSNNNPTGHIIITLSPVPLMATFRPLNSLVANTASKSILRTAIETFVQKHSDRITYFPAYEVVAVVENNPFRDDNRHVKREVIDRIMELFEAYFVETL